MSRLRRLPRPGWLGLGVILGAVLVPAGAIAATATLVSIRGNNHTAYVTPANQLRTAETDPASELNYELSANFVGLANTCTDLGAISATKAAIIKQVNVDVYQVGTMSQHWVQFFAGPNCDPLLGGATVAGADTKSVSLGSGVPVPAGTHISVSTQDVSYVANLIGYFVPSSAAPAGSATTMRKVVPRPKR